MKKQSGFTIIELVIVVVILGFLAVTAIPKFLDLTDQAKQANIEGMAGGFATGVSLVRAQWEAEGRPQDDSDRNSVSYDGTQLLLTTENITDGIRPGYVVGLNNGAVLGGSFTSQNCLEVWNNILQQPPELTDDIDTLNAESSMSYFASKSGDSADTLCHYYLKESLNRDGSGLYINPSNATDVGNSFTYQPATSSVIVYVQN
ncbi:prepilin-type N-terminal cleavage/methylation domain-containing protein [Thalassotalea sp. PLHSN55]|uniref:prepilin-type N-terminal cleavage/methylation domain-containing protein n=1 Tax=Thalassotalea sp. PLHSN55 TaxID=3435888 RepID=UPI003F863E9F